MNTDSELLTRLARSERQAFAEVYDTFSPGLYRYAYRLLGDAETAEDCVAETFSRFLEALRRGKGPRNYLRRALARTRVIHIHGLAERDHRSLASLAPERLRAVLEELIHARYDGVLTI